MEKQGAWPCPDGKFLAQGSSAWRLVEAGNLVTTGEQDSSIRAKCRLGDPAKMIEGRRSGHAGGDVPETDRLIAAGRCQNGRGGIEHDIVNLFQMFDGLADGPAGRGVPKLRFTALNTGDQDLTIM